MHSILFLLFWIKTAPDLFIDRLDRFLCIFYVTVRVPSARTHTDAVACVASAVTAYTALIYHGKITSGNTVLIMSAASANGLVAIQLASAWGAKVMSFMTFFS